MRDSTAESMKYTDCQRTKMVQINEVKKLLHSSATEDTISLLVLSSLKKKVNFINSSQNEGLSPSGIALSFDGFGLISWTVFGFSAL
jgi:hypothetical protein